MRLTTSFHQNNMVQQPAFASSGNAPHRLCSSKYTMTKNAQFCMARSPAESRKTQRSRPVLYNNCLAWIAFVLPSEKCAYALRSLARTTCFDQEHRARAFSQSETWCFPVTVHGHCLCNIVEILVMKPFVSASLHTSENSVETSI